MSESRSADRVMCRVYSSPSCILHIFFGMLQPMADDCLFCKIVRGDMPCFKIYEDEKSLSFLDIHPINPGHALVIPKADDTKNILDVSPEDWMATTEAARKVAHLLEKALDPDGINIIMNNRSEAGQVIFHPHIHVVPRYKGDGHRPWHHGTYKEGEAAELQRKISAAA